MGDTTSLRMNQSFIHPQNEIQEHNTLLDCKDDNDKPQHLTCEWASNIVSTCHTGNAQSKPHKDRS